MELGRRSLLDQGFVCESNYHSVDIYRFCYEEKNQFMRSSRLMTVSKNREQIIATDGFSFLQVEERRFINKKRFGLQEMSAGNESILIDYHDESPARNRESFWVQVYDIRHGDKIYKVKEMYRFFKPNKIRIETISVGMDINILIGCLALAWVSYEYTARSWA